MNTYNVYMTTATGKSLTTSVQAEQIFDALAAVEYFLWKTGDIVVHSEIDLDNPGCADLAVIRFGNLEILSVESA